MINFFFSVLHENRKIWREKKNIFAHSSIVKANLHGPVRKKITAISTADIQRNKDRFKNR